MAPKAGAEGRDHVLDVPIRCEPGTIGAMTKEHRIVEGEPPGTASNPFPVAVAAAPGAQGSAAERPNLAAPVAIAPSSEGPVADRARYDAPIGRQAALARSGSSARMVR
ncbi:MAG: hypothetical protein QOJ67_4190 [Acidimicrobiaceae bacterium]